MNLIKFFSLAALLVMTYGCAHSQSGEPIKEGSPESFALQKLKDQNISPRFIEILSKDYDSSERDKIIELNVLGFLSKADYSTHYSDKSVKKCIEFIRKHKKTFLDAEKKYQVPAEIITSLLWVETKHGATLGHHSVNHVYFSLIQSDHPDVIKSTIASLEARRIKADPELTTKIISRSKAKANWAFMEIKALEEMSTSMPKELSKLKGSYAGAFGIPQFIPSSFLLWARPKPVQTKKPNLFDPNDSILSVAFYLKSNGWNNASAESQKQALFHYNRTEDYGAVIQKLAQSVQSRMKRR